MEKPINNLPYMVFWWNIFNHMRYEKQFASLSEALSYLDNVKDKSHYQVWNKLESISE